MIGVYGAMNKVQLNTFLMAVPFHWHEACINGDMTMSSIRCAVKQANDALTPALHMRLINFVKEMDPVLVSTVKPWREFSLLQMTGCC